MRWALNERDQRLAGRCDLGHIPVIADAIAEAVLQVEALRVRVGVVGLPVARLALHRCQHHLLQRQGRRHVELALDVGQCPECLAQRKRDARSHFEDREVIAHQRREGRRRLIVGGVRFIDQTRLTFNALREFACLGGLIVDHFVMIELHAGLHDQRHDARPGILQAALQKCLAMGVERCSDGGWRRDSQRLERFGRATGCRYLGADHINRWLAAAWRATRLHRRGRVAPPARR